jgi:hypothetical protein
MSCHLSLPIEGAVPDRRHGLRRSVYQEGFIQEPYDGHPIAPWWNDVCHEALGDSARSYFSCRGRALLVYAPTARLPRTSTAGNLRVCSFGWLLRFLESGCATHISGVPVQLTLLDQADFFASRLFRTDSNVSERKQISNTSWQCSQVRMWECSGTDNSPPAWRNTQTLWSGIWSSLCIRVSWQGWGNLNGSSRKLVTNSFQNSFFLPWSAPSLDQPPFPATSQFLQHCSHCNSSATGSDWPRMSGYSCVWCR